ncbi:MAG: 4,5-DOPA dioxygenase extradiol [Bacteroidetes bacterium]|nr:4,5-DOPA dioxygenase extradiol [Bacteroidota bacterium]
MKRRNFIQLVATSIAMTSLTSFKKVTDGLETTGSRMPVLFVGHGNPMNAIEENEFSRAWNKIGKELPLPKAILCVSAHWQTKGTKVTAMAKPKTIHDFSGFPQELFDKQYPAPGSPEFAGETKKIIRSTTVELNDDWGLDHGCWSVLARMFPDATVPVFQLSLDYSQPPEYHYQLAKELTGLRKKGVLIVGSGNIVHNLGMLQWNDSVYDWATEFDERIKKLILSGDHQPIIHYEKFGAAAKLAVPTNEHFLPLLYALALQEKNEPVSFYAEKTMMGSISMRSVKMG